jgi:NADH-quinone oxidoreductase subunit C
MTVEEQNKIIAVVKEKFEAEVLKAEMLYDFLTIELKAEKIVEIIQQLKQHPDTKLDFLTTLCGIHYPDQNQIAVMYQLHNMQTNQKLRLKIFLNADNPVTPTITHIFAGANWMERETYDFYGVTFTGHPKLKRILNVDEMVIFPLRKEYPLEDQTRHDKNDLMFGR